MEGERGKFLAEVKRALAEPTMLTRAKEIIMNDAKLGEPFSILEEDSGIRQWLEHDGFIVTRLRVPHENLIKVEWI